MDDIADNNKDSIYQIAESKARQNGANDAHVCIFNEDCTAIHGLQTPNEAFFSSKSQTFVLGQTIWADTFWGIWGVTWYSESHFHVFH